MASIRCLNSARGENWAAIHGDCVDVMRQMPDASVGFSVYSPPFSGLYIYNDSIADMGNSADDGEFMAHYQFFVKELYRVLKPGRIVAVHCKDLVYYQTQRGTAGLRDLPGMLIRAHTEAGFDFHSRITIWRDPVREMTKTKAHGLLYKQLRADSSFSRQGLPEYFVVFRKWGSEEDREEDKQRKREVAAIEADESLDDAEVLERINGLIVRSLTPVERVKPGNIKGAMALARKFGALTDEQVADIAAEVTVPLSQWQEWASPVWMTTRETEVLNAVRDPTDEKHICPMPTDLSMRAIRLWSNPGDVVLSPFMGIGSEGDQALRCHRKFVGIELKASYFKQATVRHLPIAEREAVDLFATAAE
jgi:DNA modification methylase